MVDSVHDRGFGDQDRLVELRIVLRMDALDGHGEYPVRIIGPDRLVHAAELAIAQLTLQLDIANVDDVLTGSGICRRCGHCIVRGFHRIRLIAN